jgi:hypothetical protein
MARKKKKDNTTSLAQDAVFEAELYAQVLEHPECTPDLKVYIRVLLWGACKHLTELLGDPKRNYVDAELVRDIWPYARLLCKQIDGNYLVGEMLKTIAESAPTVLLDIQSCANVGKRSPKIKRKPDDLIAMMKAKQRGYDDSDDRILDAEIIGEGTSD